MRGWKEKVTSPLKIQRGKFIVRMEEEEEEEKEAKTFAFEKVVSIALRNCPRIVCRNKLLVFLFGGACHACVPVCLLL